MFNKKRIAVAVAFILLMFFFITFAGGTPQNQAIATRNVTFIDSYNNAELSAQRVLVGEDAEVPEDPRHGGLVFVGWYLENDRDVRVRDFTNITENVTVVALYGADLNGNGIVDDDDETYTVRFVDSTNNAVIATREVLVGMSAVPPTAPTHDGLTFTGWDASYTNVTRNITVNAIYRDATVPIPAETVTHTVSFIDTIDDVVFATVEVEDGLTVNVPEAPTHEGYVFVRWEGDLDNITEDTEIRGIYAVDSNNNGEADETETKYTVSYYSLISGTQNEAPRHESSFLTTEEYTVLENTFTLAGHLFIGWTEDENAASTVVTNLIEEDAITLIQPNSTHSIETSNVIYYAVWAEDANGDGIADYENGQKFEVTITYGYGEDEVTANYTVLKGTKYEDILPSMEVVDPTNEDDYAFDKWTVNDEDLEDVTVEITEDVTIKAIYGRDDNHNGKPDTDPSEKYYDVTFTTDSKYANLLGDDSKDTYTVSIVEGAIIGNNVPAIKAIATDKIAFDKWVKYDGIKNVDYTMEQVANTVVDSDMTFTAIFETDNDGNNVPDIYEDHYSLTIEYVNSVTGKPMFDKVELSLVENEGYKITSPVPEKGSYTISPEVVSGTMKAEDDEKVITVTYAPSKDDNGNGVDDAADTYYNVTFVNYNGKNLGTQRVLVGMDAEAPTPTEKYIVGGYNYTFDGTWNKDFTNVQRDIEDIRPNYTENPNVYVVTYMVDGEKVYEEEVTYNTRLKYVHNEEKTGYTLSDWIIDGIKKFDTSLDYTLTSDITLTANYVANKYTVTYKVDGEEYKTKNVTFDQTLTHPTAPEKEGYTFLGWFDGETKVEDRQIYTTDSNLELIAKYEIKTYSVEVEAENATIVEPTRIVNHQGNATFNLTADTYYTFDHSTVSCTNGIKAEITADGTLTVKEVEANTVCTVTLKEDRVGGENGSDGKADEYQTKVTFIVEDTNITGRVLHREEKYVDLTNTNSNKVLYGSTNVTFELPDYYEYATVKANGMPASGANAPKYSNADGNATVTFPYITKDMETVTLVLRHKTYNITLNRTFDDGARADEMFYKNPTVSVHADIENAIIGSISAYRTIQKYMVEGYALEDDGLMFTCDSNRTQIKIEDNQVKITAYSDDTCYVHYAPSSKNDGIADKYRVDVTLKVINAKETYDKTVSVKGGDTAVFTGVVVPNEFYDLKDFQVKEGTEANVTYNKNAYNIKTEANTTGQTIAKYYEIELTTEAKTVSFVTEEDYESLLKYKEIQVEPNTSLKDNGYSSLVKEDDTDGVAFDYFVINGTDIKVAVDEILETPVTEHTTYRAIFSTDSDNNGKVDESEKVTVKFEVEDEENSYIEGETEVKVFPTTEGTDITFPEVIMVNAKAYKFDAWYDEDGNKITDAKVNKGDEAKTFTAKIVPVMYTVNFYDDDKTTLLKTDTVTYTGSATAPADPTKESTAEFTYEFAGWDGSYTNVIENTSVYATYTATKRSYVVTLEKCYEGQTVCVPETTEVEYGLEYKLPVLNSKEEGYVLKNILDKDKNETISGVVTIKGERTFKANYILRTINVTYKYGDETLGADSVKYGDKLTASKIPDSIEETDTTVYEITGWTVNGVPYTSKEELANMPVEFASDDITIIVNVIEHTKHTLTVKYVDSQDNPFKDLSANPIRDLLAGDEKEINVSTVDHYTVTATINGVNAEIVNGKVTVIMPDEDVVVTIKYTASRDKNENGIDDNEEKLTVKFYDDVDGKVIRTEYVLYGDPATEPSKKPTKASSAQYEYTFDKWDKDFSNVTEDLDIYATYTENVRNYTVQYYDYYGNEIPNSRETLPYGSTVTKVANAELSGYEFLGWYKDNDQTKVYTEEEVKNITIVANTTFKAVYKEIVPQVVGIEVEPNILEFFENTTTESGLRNILTVYAVYDDKSRKIVTNYSISGFDGVTVGTRTMTIIYEGFTKNLQYTIKRVGTEIGLTMGTFAPGNQEGSFKVDENKGYMINTIKYAEGEHSIAYFQNNGIETSSTHSNNHLGSLNDNSVYTIYLKGIKKNTGETLEEIIYVKKDSWNLKK